jgi:hypothetical protein
MILISCLHEFNYLKFNATGSYSIHKALLSKFMITPLHCTHDSIQVCSIVQSLHKFYAGQCCCKIRCDGWVQIQDILNNRLLCYLLQSWLDLMILALPACDKACTSTSRKMLCSNMHGCKLKWPDYMLEWTQKHCVHGTKIASETWNNALDQQMTVTQCSFRVMGAKF